MAEGDTPEIPKHLQEGLASAEAYEQQARREFQIQEYARKLQIPEDSLRRNETVDRYVSVLRDAWAGSERLGRHEAIDPVLGGDARLRQRTAQVAHLYGAEMMILEEGFGGDTGMDLPARRIDLDPMRRTMSLTGLLDRAAQPYGLSVDVPKGWHDDQFHDVEVLGKPYRPPGEPAAGLWTGAPFITGQPEPWKRKDGSWSSWYWPDWPNERHDREHLQALAAEAARYGIAPERPRTDPVMHTLLTGLVHGRELVAETEGIGTLPPAPGLTPPAHERLGQVALLNRLAVMILEDAVRPGSIDQDRFATDLASVTTPYGLVVKGSNANS